MRLIQRIAAPLAALIALSLPAAALAADDHHDRKPDDRFKLQPLKGGVYALFGRGGNVGFFVGPKCVLMIDDEFRDLAPGIKAQIENVTDKPIKFLINTHHHGDHVGGNDFFSQFTEVIAQDQVRVHMLKSPAEVLKQAPADIDTLKSRLSVATDSTRKANLAAAIKRTEESIEWAKTVKIEEISPSLTFLTEMRVYLGDETIRLVHVCPAHTDGDCVAIFTKANVVHMGDVYFHKVIPFIDFEHGASVPGYIAFIDTILKEVPADATFIPGHGEVSDAEGLKEFRQYIVDLSEAAKAEHDAGHTLEQAQANIKLEKYKDWGGYKDRLKSNIEAAYKTMW